MALLSTDAMVFFALAVIFIPVALIYGLFRYTESHAGAWTGWRRYAFLTVKGILIALGTFVVLGRAYQEFQEGHLGIGLGVVVTVGMGLVAGLLDTISGHTPGSPAGHQGPPQVH